MAKKLKLNKFNKKIIQIVAPTVWAWRKGRAKKFAKYYDEILGLNNRLFSSLAYFDPEPIEESRVVELKF